jgi:hypothetical protein
MLGKSLRSNARRALVDTGLPKTGGWVLPGVWGSCVPPGSPPPPTRFDISTQFSILEVRLSSGMIGNHTKQMQTTPVPAEAHHITASPPPLPPRRRGPPKGAESPVQATKTRSLEYIKGSRRCTPRPGTKRSRGSASLAQRTVALMETIQTRGKLARLNITPSGTRRPSEPRRTHEGE